MKRIVPVCLILLLLCGCTAAPDSVPDGVRVPVLMYHAVSDDVWGLESLFVSPDTLRQQLDYLQDNGYTTVFFEELPQVQSVDRPVILTFDDGYADNYTELFPLLQEYGCKATIFIAPELLGRPDFLTAEQVRVMADSGLVAFESHTLSHVLLDEVTQDEAARQLTQSKTAIAAITGTQPQVLSYPEGRYTEQVLQLARQEYRYAVRRMDVCYVTGAAPQWLIPRYFVSRDTTLRQFGQMLRGEVQ